MNPDALPNNHNQAPFAPEVCAVSFFVAVRLAVVLVHPTGPDHPEVSPRHEVAPFVIDLPLRLDPNLRSYVQHTEY